MGRTPARGLNVAGDALEASHGPPGGAARSRRRIRRWVLAALGVWLLACGVSLGVVALELVRGVHLVDGVRDHLSGQDLESGRPVPGLERAHADFARAHTAAAEPLLVPLRFLPIVGRHLRSVTALTGAAATVTSTGADAIRQADVVLVQRSPDQRVAVLRRLAAIAANAGARLRPVTLGPSGGLVGPLARRRAAFQHDLDQVRAAADRAEAASSALATLLDSPHHYLLLAANNAEMRVGSGTFLSVGLLTMGGGRLELTDVRPSAELALPGDGVPITGDFADRWGFLHPNREWRNLGTSPDFPTTAALASRMWSAAGGSPVDGVLALDVEALRAVLVATGPVPGPDGQPVSADTVERFIFHDQYVGVPTDEASQKARSDRLGTLASAALARVNGGGTSLTQVGTELARVAGGRHILLWSPAPDLESDWRRAGVDGALGPDDLVVAVLNRGANKLDQYLQVSASFQVGPLQAGRRHAVISLRLRNTAPADEPAYVAGLEPAAVGVPPGDYIGLVVVYLPRWAGDEAFVDRTTEVISGPEGPSWVLASRVVVPRGQDATAAVQFDVAGTHRVLSLVPSARVPPGEWQKNTSLFDDSIRHVVSW